MSATGSVRRLRIDEFDRMSAEKGWNSDAERAAGIGVSAALLCKIRAGSVRPGSKFVHGCMAAFGAAGYDRLFEEVQLPSRRRDVPLDRLMTVEEMAVRLGVARSTVYDLVTASAIDWIDIGTGSKPNIRISEDAYQKYLAARLKPAAA